MVKINHLENNVNHNKSQIKAQVTLQDPLLGRKTEARMRENSQNIPKLAVEYENN